MAEQNNQAERAAPELLPCPFCGGEAHKDAYDRGIEIGCKPCGYSRHFPGLLQSAPNDKPIAQYRNGAGGIIEIPISEATEFYHSDANERAAEVWNRRSAPAAGTVKDAELADVLNTTLWLYRRLPHAYGNPSFVDKAILTMAKRLGMDDVPEAIKERAAIEAHNRAGKEQV